MVLLSVNMGILDWIDSKVPIFYQQQPCFYQQFFFCLGDKSHGNQKCSINDILEVCDLFWNPNEVLQGDNLVARLMATCFH